MMPDGRARARRRRTDRTARRAHQRRRAGRAGRRRQGARGRTGRDVRGRAEARQHDQAAAQGAQTGVKLAVAVGAMVLAFVALVALANGVLGWVGWLFGYRQPRASRPLLGDAVRAGHVPDRRAVGPGADRRRAVRHQGRAQRIRRLHRPRPDGRRRRVSDRSRAIVTFALCGFANFSRSRSRWRSPGGWRPTSGR